MSSDPRRIISPAFAWGVLILSLLGASELAARRVRFAIPIDALPSVILLPDHGLLISNSDSVWLGKRLLERDREYRLDSNGPTLTLLDRSPERVDSLVAVYQTVPKWLSGWYGRPIPDATAPMTTLTEANLAIPSRPSLPPSRARINGTKSIRVLSSPIGGAEFGQSLDLRIDGEISPGVSVRGLLSDRGSPGAYGPLNSRLDELDKLSLVIGSRAVTLQLGDLSTSRFRPSRSQRVAGVMGELRQHGWSAAAVAARPKGQFASARIAAQDRFQGPYQIRQTGAPAPVVPGSESVWLDGVLLSRGPDRDYQIDYAAAQITFTPRRLIDRRSRIEIDCEFQQAAYRGELLGGSVGVRSADSGRSISLQVLREGDDPDLPLSGELSATDLGGLQGAGDSDVARSGVIVDSLGDYSLMVDSLPDTVYQYVGNGLGQYRIQFSFVEAGNGRYRYLGSGVYRFAGGGSGDYDPIVAITPPGRTDLVSANGHWHFGRSLLDGRLELSRRDRNLLSSLNDDDNDDWSGRLLWQQGLRLLSSRDSLLVEGQYRGAEFAERERSLPPDWERRFFAPSNLTTTTDQRLLATQASLHPGAGISLSPLLEELQFVDSFTSRIAGVKVTRSSDSGLTSFLNVQSVSTSLQKVDRTATGDAWSAEAGLGMPVIRKLRSLLEWGIEERKNDYIRFRVGTLAARLSASLFRGDDSLQYEYYREDTLIPQFHTWWQLFNRHRLNIVAAGRTGRHSISGTFGRQWLYRWEGDFSADNYRARWQYDDQASKFYLSTGYSLSQELRVARGITYLPVEPGSGNYRFENGQYIPDPDGDFLQIEELLSEREAATVLEKQHELRWDPDWGQIRGQSRITEEATEESPRNEVWLVPGVLSKRQDTRLVQARDDIEFRLFRWAKVYGMTLRAARDLDRRTLALGPQSRQSLRGEAVLNQPVGAVVAEQRVSLYRLEREEITYSGTTVDGYGLSLGFRRTAPRSEIGSSLGWRSAESDGNARSKLLQWEVRGKIRALQRGELGANLEMYREVGIGADNIDYLLTDNRPGRQGAIWTVTGGLTLKGKTRARLNITGRHSDIRTGRVTARGELVAEF